MKAHSLLSRLAIVVGLAGLADARTVLQTFEGDGFGDWKIEGEAFGDAPIAAEDVATGHADRAYAASSFDRPALTGSLTSPAFAVREDFLIFLIGGADQPGETGVRLLKDGEVLREATGGGDRELRRVVWDVSDLRGEEVKLRVFDESTTGAVAADHPMMAAAADAGFPDPTAAWEVGALIATEALSGVKIPQGSSLRVVADHERHELVSPTALAFDERGALYVTETHRFRHGIEDNRNHLYWLKDDISSQTVEDRAAMMEKWSGKFPEGYFTEKTEMVRRLSEPGEDGVFGKSQVFSDDFGGELDGTAAGVFAYDGMVYVACIPSVSGLIDENGNGVADRKVIFQDGFGVRFSLSGHDLNGFALGPDGMLYGTVGDRGFHLTTREGEEHAYPGQGAVFRFDPDGSNFELVHTGLRNPKEIDFDEYGNAISVDNNADLGDKARIVYVVEGADSGWRMGHQILGMFHRQIGLDERPEVPWMAENMWAPANDAQPAYLLPPVDNLTSGPSGLVYHSGNGFLKDEAGRFFICDYRGSAAKSEIWSFGVEPSGAGMRMIDPRSLVTGVAATDVTASWDGRVFVSDFVGGWTSHRAGRILELTADRPLRAELAAESAKLIREGFSGREAKALAELLKHGDRNVRTRAHLELTRRPEGFELLHEAARDGEGFERLHGIWGLGVMARRGEAARPGVPGEGFVDLPDQRKKTAAVKALSPLLKDGDPEIRAQVLKVLGNAGIAGDQIGFPAVLGDPSPRVRMFAAIAAGKTKAVGSMSYIWRMLMTNADRDPYLRHAGSYALELMSKPEQLFTLRNHEDESLRLAAAIALGRMEHERVGDFLFDPSPKVANEALILIHDRMIEGAIPRVVEVLAAGGRDDWTVMQWRRALHLAYRRGGETEAGLVLDMVVRDELPMKVRREALRLAGRWSEPLRIDQSLGRYWPADDRPEIEIKPLIEPVVEQWYGFEGRLLEDALAVLTKLGIDDREVSDAALRTLLEKSEVPGGARARVLERLILREPDDLGETLIGLAAGDSDELAIAAMKELKNRDREAFAEALRAARESRSAARLQAAWELLADFEGEWVTEWFVGALERLRENRGRAVDALELLDAAAARDEPEIAAALAETEAVLKSSEEPLLVWMPALEGGDAKRGRQLFSSHPAAQCSRCHSAGKKDGGELAGPALGEVGARLTPEKMLESMVFPGAEISPGYGIVSLTLRDGRTVGGTLIEETAEGYVIDAAGEQKVVGRDEVAEISPPVSSMPPMGALLEREEIRDLIAWLKTRK
jgi:quinoprotein glucose dehydrogenase